MNRAKPHWAVRKRAGRWRVYGHGTWWDTHDTLPEAHTAATQNAAAETLYAPGGLTLLAEMRRGHNLLYGTHWNVNYNRGIYKDGGRL